jgi:RHS repeat-associated protein
VVDASTGEVVQRLEHDEFGRVLFDSNPGMQPFGFAGGLVDGDTGLVRFGARDYEAVVGRWTARDPIRHGSLPGDNGYCYLMADPLSTTDPYGFGPASMSCKAAVTVACRQGCIANNKTGKAAAAAICSFICSNLAKVAFCDPEPSPPPPPQPPPDPEPAPDGCDPSTQCCPGSA